MRTPLYAVIALALTITQAQAGSFQALGTEGGQMTSFSHNGRVATGIAGETAWRWAKDRGTSPLTGFIASNGMSSWAQPIAGAWTDGDGIGVGALAYSNSDLVGGPDVIGPYPGGGGIDGLESAAYGVSDNGLAVGLAYDANNTPIAFRWTMSDGMARLPVNRPANASRANGISAEGHRMWGWNDRDDGFRNGLIWHGDAPLDLLDSEGAPVGEANGGNRDGSVVVGSGASISAGESAWRWTKETGIEPLGIVPGGRPNASSAAVAAQRAQWLATHPERAQGKLGDRIGGVMQPASDAFAVSDDGSVIVGRSGTFPDFFATVWTAQTGMVKLADYAAANGVAIPAGWDLLSANAVSADGKLIGGWGSNAQGIDSFVLDLRISVPNQAVVEARGTVEWNDLPTGPFAGVAVGTPVTMTFRITTKDAFELDPGQHTLYPIELDTFELHAGDATDTLIPTQSGPGLRLTNDYPLSDGIHLFSTPMVTAEQSLEFELFNPGGDLFDSDDLDHINRSFGPEFFEKTAWSIQEGGTFGMYMTLESVSIHDYLPQDDGIFANGFDGAK